MHLKLTMSLHRIKLATISITQLIIAQADITLSLLFELHIGSVGCPSIGSNSCTITEKMLLAI